jgi:hypothetical protein
VKALNPVASWKESLKQQGVHDIISGMNHALNLAILRECVGTQHLKLDTMRKEEGARGVVKLTSSVTLYTPDGTTKLCGHISNKSERERVENVSDLWRNGKVHE